MTPEQQIDECLERVLNAAGSSLANYTMPGSREKLRKEMGEIMKYSYIQGSNDCYKVLMVEKKR